MRDVKIRAKSIGSNITAEEANIGQVCGSVASRGDDVAKDLINLLLEQSKVLHESGDGLSEQQLQSIARQVTESMKELLHEKDEAKRKGILGKTLEKIKGTLGTTAELLESFFKLTGLLGLK